MGSLEVARNKKQEVGVMPQQRQQQAWSSIRGGRCKRHPQQGLIGVCSICLKERLLALAIELEHDEAHADDEELEYLDVLDGAPSTAAPPCAAASDFVNPRVSSPPSHSTLSQLQHYRNQLHALHSQNIGAHNIVQPSRSNICHHLHYLDKPPASHFTSRKHKSVSSSPRHSSLAHSHQHAVVLDRHAPFSPPFAPSSRNSQPQMLHWRKQPNAVSPLSLSGLNQFISAVKDQRVDEPKLKKKKSSSLWSLLQKHAPSQEGAEEGQVPKKGSVQGSPKYNAGGAVKGRIPDSSSMREVHASLCRGDASSLLSSPRGGGSLPGRQKLANHSRSVAQQQQGGHWRSSSTADDLLAAGREASEGDVASPSWISSIFHRKGRTRSKSISTACHSSPDLNAVMTASAAAKYGRFSVDAAAPAAGSRLNDASKQEARFRRKYAALFEERGNSTSSKKRNEVAHPPWALEVDKEEEHCLQCQVNAEVQSRRMKLANFLASQANESIDGQVLAKRRAAGGLPLPGKASPPSYTMTPASPGRKAQSLEQACAPSENAPLSPGVYRISSSGRSPYANALVYSGVPKAAPPAVQSLGSAATTSSSFAKSGGAATSHVASPLDTQAASPTPIVTIVADYPDSESHVYPRSRSWSKNWNKAILSPILGFKGKAQHSSSSRKRGALSADHDTASASALQYKGEQELSAARNSAEMGAEEKRAAAQRYSFLSKDYSAFSFYFSPLRRSRHKASAEVGSSGGAGGGNMSSARVNTSDEAAGTISGMHISSRHSVDGSSRPYTRAHH